MTSAPSIHVGSLPCYAVSAAGAYVTEEPRIDVDLNAQVFVGVRL